MASAGYRWYLGAQVLSLAGTMMSYTALFWLVLHIAGGGAPALAAVDAAQCLPMLLFSRRAGIIVAGHRAARIAVVTQALQAAGSLAIGVPLLAGWMTIWYLVPLSFAIGCVQCADLPAGHPRLRHGPDRPRQSRGRRRHGRRDPPRARRDGQEPESRADTAARSGEKGTSA